MGGGKFNWKKAAGSAANGAVVGVARGALIGSGAGIPTAFAMDFVAGSVGNALEQGLTTGKVNLGKSLLGGAENAVSQMLYGTGKLNGVKDAFRRGAKTGAVLSGIDNITDAVGPFGVAGSRLFGKKPKNAVSGGTGRDPRSKCGSPDPFDLAETLGDRRRSHGGAGYGGGFSLGGFLKDVAIGGIVGGLGSVAFYGAGRAVNALGEHLAGSGSVAESTELVTYYPDNNGVLLGTERKVYLLPGDKIDRYGSLRGKYFSPTGTPLKMRALPYNADITEYRQFEVVKPFEVEKSVVKPWFGKIGLGIQYRSDIKADVLIKRGIIKKVGGN